MINNLEDTMRVLSSILDMAHGVLPEDTFSITAVIRCKDEAVPAHFMIGDDDEPTCIKTLGEISRRAAFVGTATADDADIFRQRVEGADLVPGEDSAVVHLQITDPAIESLPPGTRDLIAEAAKHIRQCGERVLDPATRGDLTGIGPVEGPEQRDEAAQRDHALADRLEALIR